MGTSYMYFKYLKAGKPYAARSRSIRLKVYGELSAFIYIKLKMRQLGKYRVVIVHHCSTLSLILRRQWFYPYK